MHPKPIVTDGAPQSKQDAVEHFLTMYRDHKPTPLPSSEDLFGSSEFSEESFSDEIWWEEEIAKRDLPQIDAFEKELRAVIEQNSDIRISPCPKLIRRITDEISRSSRQEPGGLQACRIHVMIAPDSQHVITDDHPISDNPANDCETCLLGTVDMSVNQKVATFEMFLYLFPSTSILSRLRSFMSVLSKPTPKGKKRSQSVISLTPDFVVVKRKLFRSRHNKAEIICSFSSR